MSPQDWQFKFKAVATHFFLSVMFLMIVAWIVLNVWLPYPFGYLFGSQKIFWMIVFVDFVCGPFLTFVVYNAKKSKSELILDLGVIGFVQVGALIYGLSAIFQMRPVAVVYEVDRFVVVSAAQVKNEWLAKSGSGYHRLPWMNGPWIVSIRKPLNENERQENMNLSLQGYEPSIRANWWQSYDLGRQDVKRKMEPLIKKMANNEAVLRPILERLKTPMDQLYYLPLTAENNLDGWIVILDQSANLLEYAPIGGF